MAKTVAECIGDFVRFNFPDPTYTHATPIPSKGRSSTVSYDGPVLYTTLKGGCRTVTAKFHTFHNDPNRCPVLLTRHRGHTTLNEHRALAAARFFAVVRARANANPPSDLFPRPHPVTYNAMSVMVQCPDDPSDGDTIHALLHRAASELQYVVGYLGQLDGAEVDSVGVERDFNMAITLTDAAERLLTYAPYTRPPPEPPVPTPNPSNDPSIRGANRGAKGRWEEAVASHESRAAAAAWLPVMRYVLRCDPTSPPPVIPPEGLPKDNLHTLLMPRRIAADPEDMRELAHTLLRIRSRAALLGD